MSLKSLFHRFFKATAEEPTETPETMECINRTFNNRVNRRRKKAKIAKASRRRNRGR